MAETQVVQQRARELLALELDGGRSDLFLWEHCVRVAHNAACACEYRELAAANIDRVALSAGAFFHDVGWAVQARSGDVSAWQLLTCPTSAQQLGLAAAALVETLGDALPERSLRRAGQSLLQMRQRRPDRIEASILADADNLDEFGPLLWCREARRCALGERSVDQVLRSWQRQREYHYWEARINDSFRFERSKQLARQRLETMKRFMDELTRQYKGEDIGQLIAQHHVSHLSH
jgi:HD superfamily phosphodiesterase